MNLCCVKCTSVLDKTRIEDIELDVCPQCGGLWLDRGEIERLARKSDEHIASLRTQVEKIGSAPAAAADTKTPCPACPGQLKELTLGPILIDFCGSCRGIFLDRGELDQALKTVKDSRATVASMVGAAVHAVRQATNPALVAK